MLLGRKTLFTLFLGFVISGLNAFAQSEVGLTSINGTVTDASGGLVVGAKVTGKNTGTGLQRETVTTDAGLYNLPALPVGAYDITVEQTGFKTAVRQQGVQPQPLVARQP